MFVCSDDEHMLIQHYCQSLNQGSPLSQPRSPAQILISMETEEKGELERVLNDLEQENRKLQAEYDRLKKAHDRKGLSPLPSPPEMLPVSPQRARDAELIAEAKLLRQHKGRLEARMQILEDHNKQLESQLHRLRQLLEQVPHAHVSRGPLTCGLRARLQGEVTPHKFSLQDYVRCTVARRNTVF
ncbi:dystrophin-like [Hippocampus comes]|uniref:dystrophin-like n=1 Tax=Hippocampus comes TaxID=109280 RepID=UPI00094EEC9C|nr:PREDICTED: dystrophin-like [Hippocampus comes]